MASLVAAALSSHAYTFQEPETWADRRARTQGNFLRRHGVARSLAPEVDGESDEDNAVRYARIRTGLETVRRRFAELEIETLIVLGDDQNENLKIDNLPQLGVFTGAGFSAKAVGTGEPGSYFGDPELAQTILATAVDADFDVARLDRFGNDELISHAHREVVTYLSAVRTYRSVPVFINAIHIPSPRPERCYAFGKILRKAIEAAGPGRVAIYASGGMSHFSASFPWKHYDGPATIGSIYADFDRRAMQLVREGRGGELASLTNEQLLVNGDVEMRQAIVLLGALGDAAPQFLVYEPFHKAIMGMAVGYWEISS